MFIKRTNKLPATCTGIGVGKTVGEEAKSGLHLVVGALREVMENDSNGDTYGCQEKPLRK